jgi:hypothetical protein
VHGGSECVRSTLDPFETERFERLGWEVGLQRGESCSRVGESRSF